MNTDIKRTLTFIITNVFVAVATFILLIFLYFRSTFDLPTDLYKSFGLVNITLIVLVGFIYLIQFLISEKLKFSEKLISAFVSSFPSIASVMLSYLIAYFTNPVLSLSTFARAVVLLIPIYIIAGAYMFFRYSRANKLAIGSDEITWEKIAEKFNNKKATIAFLVIMFLLGFYLRNLSSASVPPGVDEFPHLRHAILFLRGEPLTYTRALLTVTAPIILLFKIFGVNLELARILLSFLSMVAIFPLYAFMRKFDRGTAFWAVILYVLNPIVIALGSVIRDYAISGAMIYFTYWATARLITSQFQGKFRDWIHANRSMITVVGLLVIFALFDQKSIAAVVVGNILIFTFLMMIKVLIQDVGSRKRTLFLIAVLIAGGLFIVLASRKLTFGDTYITTKYFGILTGNSNLNWSYIFPQIGWLFLIYSLYLLFQNSFRLKTGSGRLNVYISLTFLGLLIFSSIFIFSGKLGVRSRYYVVFVYYMIPIVALLFTRTVGYFVKKTLNAPMFTTISITILTIVLIVNIPSLVYLKGFEGGKNLISGIDHFSYQPSYEYIKENLNDGDVVITDQLNKYDLLYDNILQAHDVLNADIFNARYTPVADALASYDHGWVIKSKNGSLTPKGFTEHEDSVVDGINFQFIERMGDNTVWYFEK